MRDPLPLLVRSDFPPIRRARLETLQINVGYRCNQSCLHCHVSAGPNRREEMSAQTAALVVRFMDASGVGTLDITGGAPELNANFRTLVREARARSVRVIDRCNLTILEEPGHEDLGEFLAAHDVDVIASLPCYSQDNVDKQRGKGVFEKSIRALRRLNALGYAGDGPSLDLVYNPQGATLPPPQDALHEDYKRILAEQHGVRFNRLLTLANMPVGRFGSMLVSRGELGAYVGLLRDAHRPDNLANVMCRSLLSVDWQGFVFDCDFNQMLGLPMRVNGSPGAHLRELLETDLEGRAIAVRDHCYGCTAGQGSSCAGALG